LQQWQACQEPSDLQPVQQVSAVAAVFSFGSVRIATRGTSRATRSLQSSTTTFNTDHS